MRFRLILIPLSLVLLSSQVFGQQTRPDAAAWSLQVLYAFTGYSDGASPLAGVVADSTGNLYGTTNQGGNLNDCNGFGCGVIYKVGTNNAETVLHTFVAGSDGYAPWAGLVRNPSGVLLYGAAFGGGTGGAGTVFRIGPRPTPCKTAFCPWNLTTVHSFDFTDGNGPQAALLRDTQGNLYGTTSAGGTADCGTVFKVDPQGQHTILYSFECSNGKSPQCTPLIDPAGNLYGTTYRGGLYDKGTVFKLDQNGGLTVLWDFTGGADGSNPTAGVIADSQWTTLFGTTQFGGTADDGVVFKLDINAHIETPVHTFTGLDGEWPLSPLVMDGNGNLYGTTGVGGPYQSGVVYKLDSQYNETLLYSFTGYADGYYPTYGSLLMDQGSLYGTTNQGGDMKSVAPPCYIQGIGSIGCGVVFKLSPQ